MARVAIEAGWQRLDKWLWCARIMRQRADCGRLVAEGHIRINRQPTDKPYARVRVGDVLTLPLSGDVRVLRVLDLGLRRGAASAARRLYHDVAESAETCPVPCAVDQSPPYRAA